MNEQTTLDFLMSLPGARLTADDCWIECDKTGGIWTVYNSGGDYEVGRLVFEGDKTGAIVALLKSLGVEVGK